MEGDELQRIAYHEAGHIVVGYHYDFIASRVTIDQDLLKDEQSPTFTDSAVFTDSLDPVRKGLTTWHTLTDLELAI